MKLNSRLLRALGVLALVTLGDTTRSFAAASDNSLELGTAVQGKPLRCAWHTSRLQC